MTAISAAIITLNEEKNIERCLQSLKGVVDEMVVVDSHSTDATVKLASTHGAKVVLHHFENFVKQKNFAFSQCKFDYVLGIDADEALSNELQDSILQAKDNLEKWKGYSFNRLTNYAGQWVYHCGWYPDAKIRLVKKSVARWEGADIHEILTLKGRSTHLKGDLLHYSYSSIADHIDRTNKYTSIAAQALFKKGKKSNFFDIIVRPGFKFMRDYFLKRGFLDGRHGFIICTINGLATFLKYAKIRELIKGKTIHT